MVEGTKAQELRCPGWQLARCRDRGWTWNIWLQRSGLFVNQHSDSIKAGGGGMSQRAFLRMPANKGTVPISEARLHLFFFFFLSQIFGGQPTSLFVAYIPASPLPLIRIPPLLIINCLLLLNFFKIRIVPSGIFKQNEMWIGLVLCSGMDQLLQGKSRGEDTAGWWSQVWDLFLHSYEMHEVYHYTVILSLSLFYNIIPQCKSHCVCVITHS